MKFSRFLGVLLLSGVLFVTAVGSNAAAMDALPYAFQAETEVVPEEVAVEAPTAGWPEVVGVVVGILVMAGGYVVMQRRKDAAADQAQRPPETD